MKEPLHIAIIGAGFSGTLLSFHLIANASQAFHLTLIEKNSDLAKGIAYKTKSPVHFLNVKVGNMSAFPDKPDHFLQWQKDGDKNAYLPRRLYGNYLHEIWQEAKQLAKEKNIAIEVIQKEVISVDFHDKFTLLLDDDSTIFSDIAVLACGVPNNKFFTEPQKKYTQNIWQPEAHSLINEKNLSHLPASTKLAIIGSGLTMLDALASLEEKEYRGEIIVISNDGKLPEAHCSLEPNPPKFFSSYDPKSARELLHLINKARKKAQLQNYDWRYVIDELRPHTQKIWQSLPKEQKKKLVPLLSLWNRHRHRMPEAYVELLKRTQQKNAFQHIAGSIQNIENGFTIHLKDKVISADYIFNCSGPEMNPIKNRSPFMKNLIQKNLLKSDEINMGALVDDNNSLIGGANGFLFTLGQLLFGTKLEITAVPELREGCKNLAMHLVQKFSL